MDSILIANEYVDSRKRCGEQGMVCKLDMEKAYDKVDCDFLFYVLRKKSFTERWLKWMGGCVVDPFFSILVNDTSKGFLF